MEAKEIHWSAVEHGNLIIVGNGFDLNLGYKTSYKHFFENTNKAGEGGFPFVRGGHDYHALGSYVLDQASVHSWYGLEDILAEYGARRVYNDARDPRNDRIDYCKLVYSLACYLKTIDLSHPIKDSVAARIVDGLYNCLIPPTFYSFNYTDVSLIGKALGHQIGSVTYVHGSLEQDNIILGVGDYAQLTSSYNFLYKTSNPNYRSSDLLQELDSCDNILIFGLSLSKVDYPYFEEFFKKVASGTYNAERKKCIRIFTYDENSRMDILRNLRTMNQGMIALFNHSDFDIIRTKDNMDEPKVSALIDKIETEWQLDV